MGGYTFLHEELERRLARLKNTEESLLFPTGFAANMAVVSALCSSPDVTIFSDELNHASIVDGARLATRQQVQLRGHIATCIIYKMPDANDTLQMRWEVYVLWYALCSWSWRGSCSHCPCTLITLMLDCRAG